MTDRPSPISSPGPITVRPADPAPGPVPEAAPQDTGAGPPLAPAAPPFGAPAPPNPALRPLWRRPLRALLMLLLPLALAAAALASHFALPVRAVQVRGHEQLSSAQVLALAGLNVTERPRPGWLYLRGDLPALRAHPYVRSVTLEKPAPGQVLLHITERRPAARHRTPRGEVVVAADGTVLPGARPAGPLIVGYGPSRLAEALAAARLLARYDVQSVAYSPWGLTVRTARGTVWGGSLSTMRLYADGVAMIELQRMNIYPWGVSSQQ